MKAFVNRSVIAAIVVCFAACLHAAEAPKKTPFDAIRALAGTWVSTKPPKDGEKPCMLVFKVTSGGSAVAETMCPGDKYEMINVYTQAGDSIVVTHYCAMGNQPRMRLVSNDNGTLKFAFVDGGNIKSRDEMHMDSLGITIKGDVLIEKWTTYENGKSTGDEVFEFKRQKS